MGQSAARTLATQLASVLHGMLAGRVDTLEAIGQLRGACTQAERTLERAKGGQGGGDVQRVFSHWVKTTARDPKKTKLTAERRTKVQARLREGYTVADLIRAVNNIATSSWHQGENDRSQRYDDLTIVCRSGSNVEKYRDMRPPSVSEQNGLPHEASEERRALLERAQEHLQRGEVEEYERTIKRMG